MAQLDLARLEQVAMNDPELQRLLQETYRYRTNADGAYRGNGGQVGRGGIGMDLQQQITQRLRALGIDPAMVGIEQTDGEFDGLRQRSWLERNGGDTLRAAVLTYLGGSALGGMGMGGGAAASGAENLANGATPPPVSPPTTTPSLMSRIGNFANSNAGLSLLQSGLRFGEGALTPDEGMNPFNDLDGELGRLLRPENAAYIGSRTGLEFGRQLASQMGNRQQPGPMPGTLPQSMSPGCRSSWGA